MLNVWKTLEEPTEVGQTLDHYQASAASKSVGGPQTEGRHHWSSMQAHRGERARATQTGDSAPPHIKEHFNQIFSSKILWRHKPDETSHLTFVVTNPRKPDQTLEWRDVTSGAKQTGWWPVCLTSVFRSARGSRPHCRVCHRKQGSIDCRSALSHRLSVGES